MWLIILAGPAPGVQALHSLPATHLAAAGGRHKPVVGHLQAVQRAERATRIDVGPGAGVRTGGAAPAAGEGQRTWMEVRWLHIALPKQLGWREGLGNCAVPGGRAGRCASRQSLAHHFSNVGTPLLGCGALAGEFRAPVGF